MQKAISASVPGRERGDGERDSLDTDGDGGAGGDDTGKGSGAGASARRSRRTKRRVAQGQRVRRRTWPVLMSGYASQMRPSGPRASAERPAMGPTNPTTSVFHVEEPAGRWA